MLALLAHPARQHDRMAEDALQFGFALDLAQNVAENDPAEIGAQRLQRPVGALELFGMGIALMGDERPLAHPLVSDWRNSTPVVFASLTSRSRARCISFASSERQAFGCTVVSTITLEKSESFAAPVRVAVDRLSWISATSFSSPIAGASALATSGQTSP